MSPPIKRQSKEIIFKVHTFFKKRKADVNSLEYKTDANIHKLVAEATGISERSVRRVIAQSKTSLQNTGEAKFSSPRRPKEIKKKIQVDDFDLGVIRRKINQFYTVQKTNPSLRKLNAVLKEDNILDCGLTYLRELLHKLGYSFKKCKSKRSLLLERPNIVEWRVKYLRAIRKFREDKRNIFFLDETYVNQSHNVQKCWQSSSEPGVYADIGKGRRLIIVHAGSRNGLVDDALLIFKSDSKTGDYHGDMNSTNFYNWVDRKLIPKLPPNSVIVMDNAAYHCVQVEKKPTMSCMKINMQNWLQNHNVPFSPTMVKAELLGLINTTQSEKIYTIDELLKGAGHTVLRLPPYHPDLNPIELVWANIKNCLARDHINATLDEKITILTRLFSEFSAEQWQKCDDHVQKKEQEYWNHDMRYDTVMEEFIINLQDDSDSSSDNSESSDSEDNMSE